MATSQNTVITEWNVQQFLDTTRLGYCVLNLEFGFQSVDETVTQITGFDSDYLTSHSLKDLIPTTILNNYDKSLQTLLSDEKQHIEIPIVTQVGQSAWVVLTCLSRDEQAIHLLMQDVTDIHLQSEQRTTTIFTSLSDSVLIVNRDKEVVQFYPNDTINLVPDFLWIEVDFMFIQVQYKPLSSIRLLMKMKPDITIFGLRPSTKKKS